MQEGQVCAMRNATVVMLKRNSLVLLASFSLCCSFFGTMSSYHRVILYFDGASRNNPRGPAGCGWVLYDMDRCGADNYVIAESAKYLGYEVSNNQAEYHGLIKGLKFIRDNIECDGLYIRGDSEVVINQMSGDYQVRSPNIRAYYNKANDILSQIDCEFYNFRHISRDKNWQADQLANDAIDESY